MREALKQYKITDEAWGYIGILGDGYDVMQYVRRWGWEPISGWGRDGWDLGSWPYVIIFTRKKDGMVEIVEYVEGDSTLYSCPTEIAHQIIDELALFHWKRNYPPEGYNLEPCEFGDQMPEELKGPYSPKR